MPDRYFQLKDTVGVDANGNLEPLVHENITMGVPTAIHGGHVQVVPQTLQITPIPGTRTLKTDDPLVADVLAQHPNYTEADPPRQRDLKKERDAVQDSKQRAAKTTPDGEES